MGVLIGVQAPNGVMLAGTGASSAEAMSSLAQLVDDEQLAEIGAMYGREYATGVLTALREEVKENVRDRGAADPAEAHAGDSRGGDDPGGGAAAQDADGDVAQGRASGAGDGPDAAEPRDGADDPEAGEQGGGSGGDGVATAPATEPPEGGPTCVICGAGVPAGWAEVSVEDYGEIRCRKCSA